MLVIISYIIKIVFSLALTYIMLYYNNSNIKKLYYEILLLNFSGILILSPVYKISLSNDSLLLFAFTFLIYFIFALICIKSVKKEYYFIYFLSIGIALLISVGHVLYVFISIGIYLYVINNLIPILEQKKSDEEGNAELK